MAINYNNTWGRAGANMDQQRSDLFYISLAIPSAVGGGGTGLWDAKIQFAVTKFPFPARSREMVATKYLNQTNFQLGAETALGQIEIPVRYAFNAQSAVLLEQWHWLTSHPAGGTSITSTIKTDGYFYWLVPNDPQSFDMSNPNANGNNDAYQVGGSYYLEGVLVAGLKPSDADMETSNGMVTLQFTLQCDRYYPINPSDLTIAATNPTTASSS